MSASTHTAGYLALAAALAGAALLGWKALAPGSRTEAGLVAVTVPALSAAARTGKGAFDANCASCHGENGAGTGRGPPLIHDIYNPGHHADDAFFLAARRGVRRHHWRFGDMPPQPQVSAAQMRAIVRYVRELQAANGIVERPHRM